MDANLIWQILFIFLVGKIVLRLAGRKSVSQMTATQMAAMIGLGTILVTPIVSKDLGVMLFTVVFIIILMIISEYLEMKFDFLETIFSGKAVIVIEKGELNIANLKRLRMSVDNLEIKLRKAGVKSINDIEYATIEVNGELGYELKDGKKPLTKDDLDELMVLVGTNKISKGKTKVSKEDNLFKEVKMKKYEKNINERLD